MVDVYLKDGTKIEAEWAEETLNRNEFGLFIPKMTADDAIRAFLDNMDSITVVDGNDKNTYEGYSRFKIVSEPDGDTMMRLRKDE